MRRGWWKRRERERKKDALRYVSDKDGKFQKICWYISEQDDEKEGML